MRTGRWDPSLPATPDNLVLLTREEADAHDAFVAPPSPPPGPGGGGGLAALRAAEPELCTRVEGVLARVRRELLNSYF